jgi:flagellar biosynthesis protein FliR
MRIVKLMEWAIPGRWEWAGGTAADRVGAWALVLARVLGLCLTAPGLAAPGLSWRFRLGLAGALGVVLAPALSGQVAAPTDWAGMAWAGAGEVLTGAILGMTAGLIVAGARAAGDLVSAQAGLSITMLFDPESGEELTPLGRLYGWVALATFLALDGPLALVRALADSYEAIPAGRFPLSRPVVTEALGQVGRALELALRAAAPPAIALIMAGVAMAWLSRTAPALPFFALALPVRVVLGTVLVLIGLAALTMTLAGAWEGLFGLVK